MKFSKSAIVALGTSLLVSPFVQAQTTPSTNNDRTFKQFSVVIDAGHGGQDSGDAQGKVAEKDVTLSLALKLRTELEQQGIQVVLTRPNNEFITLQDRVDIVNKIHPDCVVSLHGANQKKPFSFLVNYYTPASSQLAQALSRDLAKNLHLPSQPQATVQRFFMVRKPIVPAVMITGDLSTLVRPEEQQNFAVAIAGGIEDYALTIQAADAAAYAKAKAANERKLEVQREINKLSAERYRVQQTQVAKMQELLEAQRQVAKAEEQLAKTKKNNAKSKTDAAEAQALKAQTEALTAQLKALQTRQFIGSQFLLRETQPKGSPMLRKPDDSHTYSIPNALHSLPNQPAPTAMARKPEGPYNFLGTTKP